MTIQIFRARRAIIGYPYIHESPVTVVVCDGVIEEIYDDDTVATNYPDAENVIIPEDQVLLPGLVDTHVHVNEPGRTDWEGFASATRAAAAGGVTTLVDMPLNSIPSTVTMDALAPKRKIAEDKAKISVGFWGGVVPENLGTGDLRELWDDGRVFGFKCFLLHSGVDEFQPLTQEQLVQAMQEIAEFDGLIIVHAEDAEVIRQSEEAQQARGGITEVYASFEASRLPEAEHKAVKTVIDAAERTGCRAHILHLSDSGSLELLRDAQRRGVRITAETCPHYLSLLSEEIQNGATQYKCCPPIRSAANRERLWAGLVDGVISTVVSDHSPCTEELKKFAKAHLATDSGGASEAGDLIRSGGATDTGWSALDAQGNNLGGAGADGRGSEGSFGEAWGGVASVQLGLPVVWSQARLRGLALTDVVRWMCTNPARWCGLQDRGAITPGARADFVAISADDAFVVLPEKLHHKNKVSAYAQRALAGVVQNTWIGGQVVFRADASRTAETKAKDLSEEDFFPGPIVPLLDRPDGADDRSGVATGDDQDAEGE